MTSRESSIVDGILRWLNQQPKTLARKRHGGMYGVAGEPDIDACVKGRSVQIEVKRPGEKPTPLQERRLAEWQAAGAITMVATSRGDVERGLAAAELLP